MINKKKRDREQAYVSTLSRSHALRGSEISGASASCSDELRRKPHDRHFQAEAGNETKGACSHVPQRLSQFLKGLVSPPSSGQKSLPLSPSSLALTTEPTRPYAAKCRWEFSRLICSPKISNLKIWLLYPTTALSKCL